MINIKLPNRLYSVSDIQDYFKYIIKKHEIVTDNPPLTLHINKIEKGSYLKLKQGIISNL